MDQTEVRNFEELAEFIQQRPEAAREIADEWSEFATSNPEVRGFKTAEEWYSYVSTHPGTDSSLWVGREMQIVLSEIRNNRPTQQRQQQEKPVEIPGGSLLGNVFGTILEEKYGPDIINNDVKYFTLAYEEKAKWLKANNKKDFYSTEGLDFIYGSLDNNTPSSLSENTIKRYEELAKTNKKYADKLASYKKNKAKIASSPEADSAVIRTDALISSEIYARYQVALKALPKGTPKEKLQEIHKDISKKVTERAWERFVIEHPEKAAAYSTGKFEKKGYVFAGALKRVEEKKYQTLQRIQTEEAINKKLEQDQKREAYEKEEAAKRQADIDQARKENAAVPETNDKIHRDPEEIQAKDTVAKLADITKAYQERNPQTGLVDLKGRPLSSSSIETPRRRIVDNVITEVTVGVTVPQAPDVSMEMEEEEEEEPENESGDSSSENNPQQQSGTTPAQQAQNAQDHQRNLARIRQQIKKRKQLAKGVGRAGRKASQAARLGANATRAGAMAARTAIMWAVGNPIVLTILGYALIILLFIVFIVMLFVATMYLFSNNKIPPEPRGPSPTPAISPGTPPIIPPGGGGSSPIAQCTFTRAGNKYSVKSTKLQQYFIDSAVSSGIPASILASIAMHETLDFVANADDNHDSIVSGNYCVKGPPFCELRGQAISERACTPEQIARGARTGTATGLMQNVDIFNPGVDLCSIRESLSLASNKLKRDGLSSDPQKAEVLKAVRNYYNACMYGSHNYCEDVWNDYQSCLASQTPPVPPIVTPGQRPSAPVSTNLAADIKTQFGITMEGFSQQHLQWTWEKFWEISNTKFNSLVRNTKVVSSNDSAQLNNFLITLVAYNDEKLFKAVLIHEFGHIIRWRTDTKLNEVKQAINAEGYLTTYSSNQGGCAAGRQVDEDYAEMVAYYLNPETPSRTSRCSSGPNPFANGTNPLHYNIARDILGDF